MGFPDITLNCACAKLGCSRQLDLDIVYIVNSERAKNIFFVAVIRHKYNAKCVFATRLVIYRPIERQRKLTDLFSDLLLF